MTDPGIADKYALLDVRLTRTEVQQLRLAAIGQFVSLMQRALTQGIETGAFSETANPVIAKLRNAACVIRPESCEHVRGPFACHDWRVGMNAAGIDRRVVKRVNP
jgi:hypothetical protein